MLSRRIAILTLSTLAIGLLGFSGACNRPSKPVVRAGDTWVGQDRWVQYLKASKMDMKTPKPQKEKALQALVRRSVAAELAVKKGLDKEILTKAVRENLMEQTLVYQVLQDRIDKQPAFTEADIKKYYDERSTQVHLRRIPCLTEAEANACAEDLKAGKPFRDVLAKYCTDKAVLKSEGDIGWMTRHTVPPPFVEAIFAAKEGGIAGPFKTEITWDVVVVIERRSAAEATYALQKPKVLEQMELERVDRLRRELVQETQKKANLEIIQNELPGTLDPKPLPADAKTVVAKVGNETISMADLKRFYVSMAQRQGDTPPPTKANLAKYLTMMAGEKSVLAEAKRSGMEKRKDIAALVWNTEQDTLAMAFSERYVKAFPVPKEVLKAFYEQNKSSFAAQSTVGVTVFKAGSDQILRKAVDEIRAGASVAATLKKYPVETPLGPEPKPFDFANPPVKLPPQTVRALSQAPVGAWLGVFPGEGGYFALRVASTKAGPLQSFEEAGDAVRVAYLRKNATKIVDEYLDGEGRKGMKVETFPANL